MKKKMKKYGAGGSATTTPTTKAFVNDITPKSRRSSNNSDREGISPMKPSMGKPAPMTSRPPMKKKGGSIKMKKKC